MQNLTSQYLEFKQENIQALFKEHNVSRHQITPNHPAMQALEHKLQNIENALAKQHNRKAARVIMTQATVSMSMVTGAKSAEERWHQEVSHNFARNTHKFAWYTRANEPCEFDLLIALQHEAEHANQSVGFGYTQDEKALVWVERACRSGLTDNYWSQLSEMSARMKEAEFCIEMLTTHKAHLSVYNQQSIMHLAESVLRRLTYNTTPETIQQLQQYQKEWLDAKRWPAKYLGKAFPDVSVWQRNDVAMDFLEHKAPNIYNDWFQRLQDVQRVLADHIAEWQVAIPAAIQQHEHEQEITRLTELARQYGVPVITEQPQDAHALPIHRDPYAERHIQNTTQHHYSPALVVSNKPTQLIYDNTPIPRPYSTSPALRMQWQAENEATIEDEHSLSEPDSHDEIDDL